MSWNLPKVARVQAEIAKAGGEIFEAVDDKVDDGAMRFELAVGDPGGAAVGDRVVPFPNR